MEKASSLFDKVFDGFKKVTPALFAILLGTGLILFLPQSIMERTGLEDIPNNWKVVLGVSFFMSLSILLAIAGFGICKFIRKRYSKWSLERHRIKQLRSLSQHQREILKALLESQEKRVLLHDVSGDTQYLMRKGYILQPRQAADFDDNGDLILYYVPYPWLIDLYRKNPRII